MATPRSLTTVPSPAPARHRLRAVDRDETPDLADLLPPGTTWLPAPQHILPALPGRPPMVGYLVLVPADRQPPFLPAAVPEQPETGEAGKAGEAGEAADESDDSLIRIDTVRRTAEVAGRELELTYLEFELLAHLARHPRRVYSREHLVTHVWGYEAVGDKRTVDVHVARLRRKLGPRHRNRIATVRGVGYRYVPAA